MLIYAGSIHTAYSQRYKPKPAETSTPSPKKNAPASVKRTPKKTPRPPATVKQPPKILLASLILNVVPKDSKITIKLLPKPSKGKTRAVANPVVYSPVSGQPLSKLSPGKYELTVVNQDYQEHKSELLINPGDNKPQTISLIPKPASFSLKLSAAEKDSRLETTSYVTLEDKNNGTTFRAANSIFNLAIPPGNYALKIETEGYLTKERELSVKPNDKIILEIELVKNPAPAQGSSIIKTAPMSVETFEPASPLPQASPKPVYPDQAKRLSISGVVTIRFEIDAEGRITSMLATGGHNLLRKAAEEAARNWRFSPAKRNGIPVSSSYEVNFRFTR